MDSLFICCKQLLQLKIRILLLLSTVHYHNKSFYQSMFKIIAIFFVFYLKNTKGNNELIFPIEKWVYFVFNCQNLETNI